MKAFAKDASHLKINEKLVRVSIDGFAADPSAICSTFCGEGDVAVTLILPRDGVVDPSPGFLIDVHSATGEVLCNVSTRLRPKWLAKPLAKALIDPLLAAEGLSDIGFREVLVNGQSVDYNAKASTFATSAEVGEPVHVVVVLRAHQRPLAARAPAAAPSKSSKKAVPAHSQTFLIEMTAVGDTELLASMETTPKPKWLASKTLVDALVVPSLKAAKLTKASVKAIEVDGSLANGAWPAASVVHADGSVVKVVLRLEVP